MIDETKTQNSREEQKDAEPVEAIQTEGTAEEVTGELSPETMKAAIEALQAENDELKDKLLRAMADQENLRRRAEREKSEAGQYATTAFARDLLGVVDNFGRAMSAVPNKDDPELDESIKAMLTGIEMIEREMLNVFERHGIRRFDPQGERFDPNVHQAMFEVEDTSQPSGMVVQVLQTGYHIGERVLRPALVGVSKGGPKPVTPA